MTETHDAVNYRIVPVTPELWGDLELLFGERGACGGCWCMYWRLSPKEFDAGKKDGNRTALKALVDACQIPGLLAFDGSIPIGWCSVAPRELFHKLNRSRVLGPVDQRRVWSVVCFFVDKNYRRKGLTLKLLEEAIPFAKHQGAEILEGYPIIPSQLSHPAIFLYTGIYSTFLMAGFVEVLRRSKTRPIMRYFIKN